MTRKSNSGITLVEILIAVSLLSLLSVGMLVAMRLGLSTMDRTDAHLVKNRRAATTSGIIESEISGFMFSEANYRPSPQAIRRVLFLQAESQSMRFVTSFSVENAWRGRPQIAALTVIPGENNRGVRLIVNETPWTGPDQAGQMIAGIETAAPRIVHYAPIEAGSQSFVLADKLASCSFSWLEPLPRAPFQRWRPDWIRQDVLPLAVRIEMTPLDTTPADLHISTVTVPFGVNLQPGSDYVDR